MKSSQKPTKTYTIFGAGQKICIVKEMLVMMYKREDLVKKTSKELLVVAKEMNVVGRHDMRKEQLIDAIVSKQTVVVLESEAKAVTNTSTSVVKSTGQHVDKDVEAELALDNRSEEWDNQPTSGDSNVSHLPKPKEEYIDNAKVGTIIAFKVNNAKVISGMIEEIHKSDFLVRTKSGVRFTVRKKNIVWVKTGPRWPKGVYLALKGEAPNGECQAAN